MGETGAPFDFDLGAQPIESGWLYKERGVVCGPVSASVLIDKLFAGNLDGDTSISPEFGEWRPLREVSEFEGPLAKAQAAIAADKARHDERRLRRHILLGRTGLVLFVAIAFGSTGFFSGRYLATERPWEDHTDWTTHTPGIVALSVRPVVKQVPGTTAPAVGSSDDSAGAPGSAGTAVASADTPGRDSRRAVLAASRKAASAASASRDDKKAGSSAAAAGSDDKTGDSSSDGLKVASSGDGPMEYNAAGLPRTLTQNQIMKVLATQKGAIVNCLAAEAKINTDMPETVTIEFVVTAEGTPSDFKVMERQVRDGNLAACLRAKVMTLRWPKVYGENKTVKIPFNIKRR